MKIVAIIQARMGSTRLPGKIMKKVMDKPLLEYQIERVSRSEYIDQTVIATTTKNSEKPVVDLCKRLSISYYCGSEEDVLSRYYEAAKRFSADIVIRLTSDCPLIDPNVIDKVIQTYLIEKQNYDFVANTIERTYPRGMDTSIFPYTILQEINEKATSKSDREHVTSFLYRTPRKYKKLNVRNNDDYSKYRLTVDEYEDYIVVSKILRELYPKDPYFTLKDIVSYLERNPNLVTINQHIEQKKVQ